MSWWYTIQQKISKQVLTYRILFSDSASIYMEEIHTTFAGKTKIPVGGLLFCVETGESDSTLFSHCSIVVYYFSAKQPPLSLHVRL